MKEQLGFAETVSFQSRARKGIGTSGIPLEAEVATIERAEFLAPVTIREEEFPNLSTIISHRSEGQGIRFYDTMLGTDGDLAAFVEDLIDDVLHFPMVVRPASESPEHKEHARFLKFGFERIPNRLNAFGHFLTAYPRGFSVTEKIYEVVSRGEWAGAVVYADLLDKPQRWFTFDRDRRLRFRTADNFTLGELVNQQKFVVVTYGTNSNPWGYARLDLCYWPWYLKHHAMRNQAVFFEKWASPTVKVEYETSRDSELNRAAREKAVEVMQSIQHDQTIAVPKGLLVNLLESARNGTISFESYIDQLTKIQSRIITGQLLTMMGDEGGSYGLGKVHEKRFAKRAEMLAKFVSSKIARYLGRELIDRNFGPQDAYPRTDILARSLLEKQGYLQIEKDLVANGHKVSKSWSDEVLQNVTPLEDSDELQVPENVKPGQTLPAPAQLASPSRIELAARGDLREKAQKKAEEDQAKLEKIGAEAAKKARPAIRRAVRAIAGKIREKKSLKAVTRAFVLKTVKAYRPQDLADAFETMLERSGNVSLADPEKVEASDASKIAVALLLLAIAQRIANAAREAPEGTEPKAFADSLSDPEGVAVDETFSNLFEGTHSTNIASIATANLRRQLGDPKFRKQFPYVMIVSTNPEARLAHRMMDGFVLAAEDARYSDLLPPFDFGCKCRAIPISAETARAAGLTGSQPYGSLVEFLAAKGATPSRLGGPSEFFTADGQRFTAGTVRGFAPAFSEIDMYSQLYALREKAEELRGQDPEAWATLQQWLLLLFAYDILRRDPPREVKEVPDEQAS